MSYRIEKRKDVVILTGDGNFCILDGGNAGWCTDEVEINKLGKIELHSQAS